MFAEAYSNLGNALHDLEKPEEAASACRRALELKPDFAEAHSDLGNALKFRGNWMRRPLVFAGRWS